MPLPDLTHLQFLILAALLDGELPGRQLRQVMADEGAKKSAPAFYQLMARLEDAKFVEGRYEQKVVDGQVLKERVYTLTGGGSQVLEDVREFYASRSRANFHGHLGGLAT